MRKIETGTYGLDYKINYFQVQKFKGVVEVQIDYTTSDNNLDQISFSNFEMNFILIKLMVFINKKNMRKRDRERTKEKKRKFFF